MPTREELDQAVSAGVLTKEQAGKLGDFLAKDQAAIISSPSGEEDLRFIRNFHDVFLATGIAIFGVGLAIAAGYVSGTVEELTSPPWHVAGAFGGAAAIMWLLGEYFARHKRLFLPAITICLGFTLFVFVTGVALYASTFWQYFQSVENDFDDTLRNADGAVRYFPLFVASIATLAPLAFYLRFRLPFSIGLAAAAATTIVMASVFIFQPEAVVDHFAPLVFVSGLGVFATALIFDARDPMRQGRFSDNAFWLHFAAAPLVLNGLLWTLFGVENFDLTPARAAAILGIVAVLGFIALAINRRALLVASLLTAGVSIAVLFNATEADNVVKAAGTLLVLGGSVILLGAGWRTARRGVLAVLPKGGIMARIFPPERQMMG